MSIRSVLRRHLQTLRRLSAERAARIDQEWHPLEVPPTTSTGAHQR